MLALSRAARACCRTSRACATALASCGAGTIWSTARPAATCRQAPGKFQLFDTGFGLAHILTSSFALPTAIIGGALFSMASHGSDQLIVQRILATKSLRDGRPAMGSGVFVARACAT